MAIERGNKNNNAQLVRRHAAEHIEAADLRHLDIKKDELGVLLADQPNRVNAVRAFSDDFEIRLLDEELSEPVPRQSLVINDNGSKLHTASAGSAAMDRG